MLISAFAKTLHFSHPAIRKAVGFAFIKEPHTLKYG
jgi:hypothetical protein